MFDSILGFPGEGPGVPDDVWDFDAAADQQTGEGDGLLDLPPPDLPQGANADCIDQAERWASQDHRPSEVSRWRPVDQCFQARLPGAPLEFPSEQVAEMEDQEWIDPVPETEDVLCAAPAAATTSADPAVAEQSRVIEKIAACVPDNLLGVQSHEAAAAEVQAMWSAIDPEADDGANFACEGGSCSSSTDAMRMEDFDDAATKAAGEAAEWAAAAAPATWNAQTAGSTMRPRSPLGVWQAPPVAEKRVWAMQLKHWLCTGSYAEIAPAWSADRFFPLVADTGREQPKAGKTARMAGNTGPELQPKEVSVPLVAGAGLELPKRATPLTTPLPCTPQSLQHEGDWFDRAAEEQGEADQQQVEAQPDEPELTSLCCSTTEPESFIPTDSFTGLRPGYAFKMGPSGLGFYIDQPLPLDADVEARWPPPARSCKPTVLCLDEVVLPPCARQAFGQEAWWAPDAELAAAVPRRVRPARRRRTWPRRGGKRRYMSRMAAAADQLPLPPITMLADVAWRERGLWAFDTFNPNVWASAREVLQHCTCGAGGPRP